jgi:hypothetical protein
MIDLNTKAVKLEFVTRNPDIWDSVDSWKATVKFYCAYSSITTEMQVRAGRDSGEKGLRVWYKDVELKAGDRLKIIGSQWLVVYSDDSSSSGIKYCDVKEV